MKNILSAGATLVLCAVMLGAFYLFLAAPKNHTHSRIDLYESLRDGAYDDSFLETDLLGTDLGELSRWTRPLYVQFLDREGAVVGRPVLGMGIMCNGYVVTSSFLFNARNAGIEDLSQLSGVSVIIRANTNFDDRGRDEEVLIRDFQRDTLYVNGERGFVVLPRPVNTLLPEPTGCGVAIGTMNDLSVGNVLFQPGFYANAAPYDLDAGKVSSLNKGTNIFVFSGTVEQADTGSPVFSMRDGKPELVGMVVSSFTRYGNESKAVAISFASIVEEVESATGVNLLEGAETE